MAKKRDALLRVRMTAGELRFVQKAAKRRGLDVSEHVRRVLVFVPDKVNAVKK